MQALTQGEEPERREETPLRDKFCGRDSFAEAMAEFAHAQGQPVEWNAWQKAAGEIATDYPGDAPTGRSSRRALATLRVSILTAEYGEHWMDKIRGAKNPAQNADEASGGCTRGAVQNDSDRGQAWAEELGAEHPNDSCSPQASELLQGEAWEL